jgi:Ca-activated chloride channel family protein
MTDVKIDLSLDEHRAEQGAPVNRVYPKGSLDLFAGEQLVVVGRYKTPGNAKVVVSGSIDGQARRFDFPAKLVDKSTDETNAFVEKLWAVRRVGEILDELDLKGKNDELVKELVELSTRHGILTPYTSFLADEGTGLHDLAANASRADRRLDMLRESSGQAGFAQRAFKGRMQYANGDEKSAKMAAESFAQDAGIPTARMGGMGGGLGDMSRSAAGPAAPAPSPGNARGVFADKDAVSVEELEKADEKVRTIGNRAFYRRGAQWVDGTLNRSQQDQATHVKQFSREYFDLVHKHGRTLSQYLVFDDPVLVNLEGRAYLIEP